MSVAEEGDGMAATPESRIELVDVEKTTGELKAELERTKGMLGAVPNVFLVVANSAPALAVMNELFAFAKKSSLGPATAEQLALALATPNKCQYCARAHSALAAGAGLSAEEILSARKGKGADARAQAAIDLALELNKSHGLVEDALLEETRAAGITDEQIIEIILFTTQNIFTHMVNNLAGTPCEFPEVPAVE